MIWTAQQAQRMVSWSGTVSRLLSKAEEMPYNPEFEALPGGWAAGLNVDKGSWLKGRIPEDSTDPCEVLHHDVLQDFL